MSTQEREIRSAGLAGLVNPPQAASLDADKSLLRFLWDPFGDINLVGPEGLWIRLGKGTSYYGQGKPGETRAEYEARGGNLLLRCQAYPLWNIQYQETLTNLGKFTPEQARAGNALGSEAGHEEVTIHAGVCAADMVSLYGQTHGLRVLTPLIGMEDLDTVAEIIKLVQPFAWKLTNWRQENEGGLRDEETLLYDLADRGPAEARIQGAKLDADLTRVANATRKVMLAGASRGAQTARADWADLLKQLNDASIGKAHVKTTPSKYDEHVAFLLGEAVPSAVVRPNSGGGGSDPDMKNAVQLLTDFVTGGQQSGNTGEVEEMKSILSQMRGERTRLEKLKRELAGHVAAEPETPANEG